MKNYVLLILLLARSYYSHVVSYAFLIVDQRWEGWGEERVEKLPVGYDVRSCGDRDTKSPDFTTA